MNRRFWIAAIAIFLATISLIVVFATVYSPLTISFKRYTEPPRHVETCFTPTIDVEYTIDSYVKLDNEYLYEGTGTFTFCNRTLDEEIRIFLPLLRAAYWTPNCTQYIDHANLADPWKVEQTIVLKKGEKATIVVPIRGITDQSIESLTSGYPPERWALVFGAPHDEAPDRYVVGTVLTNPIQWKNKETDDPADEPHDKTRA